ncbi:MAG: hypothetical protein KBD37_08645 [Burkholderiales bacterium]|nr:hypothetical protein [Burkholderiales bacterium]
MLDDINFLNKVVELYKLIYFNESTLLIGINDYILFAGKKIQAITNINTELLSGKNYLDILPLPEGNIDNIKASIKKVLLTKIPQEFLSINLNHNPDYLILDCILKPIINCSTDNIVAISVESRKLNAQLYLYKLLLFLEKTQFKLNQNVKHTDALLTLREHEIAFLLFYCKSAKKIALFLSNLYDKSVTAKTISNIISGSLYLKLKVYGIDALMDKLQSLGYHNKIPVSFLMNMHLDLE